MRSGTRTFKRLQCGVCNTTSLTSVAKVDDEEFAMSLPPEWRLLWSKGGKSLQFWCDECWNSFAVTLDYDDE